MKEIIITSLTSVAVAIISCGIGVKWYESVRQKKAKKDPVSRMVLSLVRKELLDMSKDYIAKGYIPEDEFETFNEMGESYLFAGGNSIVKKLYLQAIGLPIKKL